METVKSKTAGTEKSRKRKIKISDSVFRPQSNQNTVGSGKVSVRIPGRGLLQNAAKKEMSLSRIAAGKCAERAKRVSGVPGPGRKGQNKSVYDLGPIVITG